MSDYLTRTVAAPVEVVGDGRTILARVAPYNTPALVDDGFGPYREVIEPGAFEKVMRARPQVVRVHLEHFGDWVGRGDKWLDGPDGLSMALRLDDTEPGRVAAYKIRDGQATGMSIGFVPGRTVTKIGPDGPVEHRLSIRAIHHVAIVPDPAYSGAKVEAVRAASTNRISLWQQWLESQHH